MKRCKQASKTYLSRSNSKHGRQSFCRCITKMQCNCQGCVCSGGQQTPASLPLHIDLCLVQNAYEALSVELGYQILVDSAQERVASEEAQRNVKLIPQ